jgi:choline dehydrogenase-like flavoprotein
MMDTSSSTFLSCHERRTLEVVCDTLLPSLRPQGRDDPTLFALDARSVGVAPAMEAVLATLDGVQQAQFRVLLRALEQPATIWVLVGRARRFSNLRLAERERVMLALANNRLPMLRTGFQGLKRLATFLFYSLVEDGRPNPIWAAIGYKPSGNPPAIASGLTITGITAPLTLECDVCIIGSGAGGGVVAAEMAGAGKRVVVLEAGGGQQAPDYDQRELPGMRDLYLDAGVTSSRDLGVAILAGATLGGGTAINWQTSLALPPDIRDEWATLSGCCHFAGESFTRSFDAVMARLNVGTVESLINPNNDALRRGCEALGYPWHTIARNSRDCDPRQCGYCVYGCRHGGKQSTALTYLDDAQRLGDTTIIAGCRAERVLIKEGRVRGVEARSKDGHRVIVRAPVVAVAAGAIHSPLLLMRSGVNLPALGRNLFLHPTSAVGGVYDEPVEMWNGPPQTVMCDHFARLDDAFGFRMEVAPGHPGLVALAFPWYGARNHRRQMNHASHTSAIIVLARDREGGRVRPGSAGRPLITYRPGVREQAYLRRGIAEAARVHLAAGARSIVTLHTHDHGFRNPSSARTGAIDDLCARIEAAPVAHNRSVIFSAHQMGTCRMGTSPRNAVCDPDGQVFGVRGLYITDASAFPASSGVNPMITIMALAHHTAQRMKSL